MHVMMCYDPVCVAEAEELNNRLQTTRQRVSELERTLSSVSTQQKQFERVTYFIVNQLINCTFYAKFFSFLFDTIHVKRHTSVLNVFFFYLQQNKELEKERDNLRLEVLRLK